MSVARVPGAQVQWSSPVAMSGGYDASDEDRSSADEHESSLPSSAGRGMSSGRGPRCCATTTTGARNSGSACFAPWIPALLTSGYFQPCTRHQHLKKNECTFFCATCASPQSVCQHCMGLHAGHHLVQVRRYVYCDVVRACDINPFVDTTGVQNYIINSAKVMFLNHRPHTKMGRTAGVDTCRTCQRHLREGYAYCSLACKVEALTGGSMSPQPEEACCSEPSAPAPAAASAAAPTSAAPLPRCPSLCGSAPSLPSGLLRATSDLPQRPPPTMSPVASAACIAGLLPDHDGSEAGEDAGPMPATARAPPTGTCSGPFGTRAIVRDGVVVRKRYMPAHGGAGVEAAGASSEEGETEEFNFENPPRRKRTAYVRQASGPPCQPLLPFGSAPLPLFQRSPSATPAPPQPPSYDRASVAGGPHAELPAARGAVRETYAHAHEHGQDERYAVEFLAGRGSVQPQAPAPHRRASPGALQQEQQQQQPEQEAPAAAFSDLQRQASAGGSRRKKQVPQRAPVV